MSRWTPKIFGHCTRGSCKFSMSILGGFWLGVCPGRKMLLTTLGQGSTERCPSCTQLSPQDCCLGYPPYPES